MPRLWKRSHSWAHGRMRSAAASARLPPRRRLPRAVELVERGRPHAVRGAVKPQGGGAAAAAASDVTRCFPSWIYLI